LQGPLATIVSIPKQQDVALPLMIPLCMVIEVQIRRDSISSVALIANQLEAAMQNDAPQHIKLGCRSSLKEADEPHAIVCLAITAPNREAESTDALTISGLRLRHRHHLPQPAALARENHHRS
jgi:hypothetical protein